MGICKCSKRRVTQQFCFEHRVNVCEFCMVNGHPACIVQPYLQWLEDSTYKAKCSFCQLNLSNEECVRLLCYHVFHLTCLNKYCSSLPANTTPAGYTCIDCNIPIFPSANTPSPIYTALKKRLCTTEWARVGLGLPITSSPSVAATSNNKPAAESLPTASPAATKTVRRSDHRQVENPANTIQQTLEQKHHLNSSVYIHHDPQTAGYAADQSIPVAVNSVSSYLNHAAPNDYLHSNHNNFDSFNSSTFNSSARKIVDSDDRDRLILDIDDDKYRHRSPLDRLSRNFKLNVKFLNYKLNLSQNQRFVLIVCLAALVIFTVFYYAVKQARQTDDPLLDFKYNPNIHVQDDDNFN